MGNASVHSNKNKHDIDVIVNDIETYELVYETALITIRTLHNIYQKVGEDKIDVDFPTIVEKFVSETTKNNW